jgi:hypothetical protein
MPLPVLECASVVCSSRCSFQDAIYTYRTLGTLLRACNHHLDYNAAPPPTPHASNQGDANFHSKDCHMPEDNVVG